MLSHKSTSLSYDALTRAPSTWQHFFEISGRRGHLVSRRYHLTKSKEPFTIASYIHDITQEWNRSERGIIISKWIKRTRKWPDILASISSKLFKFKKLGEETVWRIRNACTKSATLAPVQHCFDHIWHHFWICCIPQTNASSYKIGE